ncbi:MAG TPA: hypothetical protein VFN61_14165 [Acidimicrobiales bacterium]|nr:hypothetical protein [Acidimicrobiales bacterium]
MGGRRLHEELRQSPKHAPAEQQKGVPERGAATAVGPLAELQRKAGNAAVVGMLAGRTGPAGHAPTAAEPVTIAGFSLLPGAISREWVPRQHDNEATEGVVQRVKIAGFNLSGHAAERRTRTDISSPITNKEIEGAINGGTAYDDGTGTHGVVYYLGDVAVVTAGKNIVTVYRTPQADKPKARWTKL